MDAPVASGVFDNAVMEAEPQADGESWRLTTGEGAYQLRCLGAVSASGEDE